jgi:type IV secretory pathway VirB4 component
VVPTGRGPSDLCATVSFFPLGTLDLLCAATNAGQVIPCADCSARGHTASQWLDLAEGRLAERTITGLSVLLQSNALKQALQPYTLNGPWGRLLDADNERLGQADVQAFETEGLIGAGAAPAVLSYLFHRIEDRFDGRPTLLIIDEGWLALDDKGFAGQLREWLKTLRKKNASVIFATQSLADTLAPIANGGGGRMRACSW